jgi:hypothetical protein
MQELITVLVALANKGVSNRIIMRFCGVIASSVKDYRGIGKEFHAALSKQRRNSEALEPTITEEPAQAHEAPKRGRRKKEFVNETSEQHDNA